MNQKTVWGYKISADNALTTKFLQLLAENNYKWSGNDQHDCRLFLGHKEKERLLSTFNTSIDNEIDEFGAMVGLSVIKEIYDEECKRLFAASKKYKSTLPWFSLARQLFQERGGREISIQEFKRNELANLYNHLIEVDLLIISNRDLHLQAIQNEFLKFTIFVTKVSNKKHFLVFLLPVFQHLYLLVRSHSGKSIADKFIRAFIRISDLPPSVLNDLLNCDSFEDLQYLINREARIRVKLSSHAYHTFVKWLKECFSPSSQMFNILRVLHENFHIDLYEDKDDKDFAELLEELMVLNKKAEDLARKTPQNAEDRLSQKMSKLEIEAKISKLPEMPSTSESIDSMSQKMSEIEAEAPRASETPSTSKSTGKDDEKTEMSEDSGPISEKNTGGDSNFEAKSPTSYSSCGSSSRCKIPVFKMGRDSDDNFKLKASDFKLKDSARRYIDEVKQSGMTEKQMIEALMNYHKIADHSAVSSENDDIHMQDSSEEQDLNDVTDYGDGTEQQNIEPSADQDMRDVSGNDKDGTEQQNIQPPVQDASNVAGDGDGTEQQNIVSPDQDMRDVTGSDNDGAEQQNIEPPVQDTSNETAEGARTEEHQGGIKYYYKYFKESYKTNFHSAVPITISGKDIVCSADISPDLRYMACGFKSCKIVTWRLLKPGFSLQLLGTLRGHTEIVSALSIDSNKKILISGSHDHTVRMWEIETSICLQTFTAHEAPVYTVCISPNSKYFLSASNDGNILLHWYDYEYPFQVFVVPKETAINCVHFHPNCAYFACAGSHGNLFMFKINDDSRPVRMFLKHKAEVSTLSFSPSGRNLASADIEGMIVIWDILTYAPINICETGMGIRSISYDNSGTFLAVLFNIPFWNVYNLGRRITVVIGAKSQGIPISVNFTKGNKMFIVQYIDADKKEIEEAKDKPKTEITAIY